MAWNKPTSNTVGATSSSRPSGRGKIPRLRTVCLMLAVALGAGLAAWLFSGREARQDAASTKERGRIKEVMSAVAAPTNAIPKKPVDPKEDYDHTKMYRDKDGVLRYNSGCRAHDPTLTYVDVRPYWNPKLAVFTRRCDKMIVKLMTQRPGGHGVPDRVDFHSAKFLEDFKESLKEPIIISPDDSKSTKYLKEALKAGRQEIVDRMAKGEKLGDILEEARKEIQRLNEYRNGLEKNIDQFVKDKNGEATDQDIADYVEAANKMLEENGIRKISLDRFVEQNIRLAQKNLEREQNQEQQKKEK